MRLQHAGDEAPRARASSRLTRSLPIHATSTFGRPLFSGRSVGPPEVLAARAEGKRRGEEKRGTENGQSKSLHARAPAPGQVGSSCADDDDDDDGDDEDDDGKLRPKLHTPGIL